MNSLFSSIVFGKDLSIILLNLFEGKKELESRGAVHRFILSDACEMKENN